MPAKKTGGSVKQTTPKHWGGSPSPEELDPTPMELPAGHTIPTPLHELIANFVRSEREALDEEEYETYEEANDFEEEEDPGLLDFSPYELQELEELEPPPPPGSEEQSAVPEAAEPEQPEVQNEPDIAPPDG